MLRLAGDAPPADLAWLGVIANATRSLAEGAADHEAAVARLKAAGRLYPCFESEDELRWKRDQRVRHRKPPVYDRAMLKMTEAQRASAEAGGKIPYWRFRLSDAEVSWRDRVAGPQSVKLTAVSDPVVLAADGAVSSALTAAIDDARDGIDLLVRDLSQIEATGIHLDLLAALGGAPSHLALAHLPPLPDSIATLPLRGLRQDGVEASALATMLATPLASEPATMAELANGFDLATCSRGLRSISLDRLSELNRAALRALPYDSVADRLPRGADAAFWDAIRGGIMLLSEARHWWDVVGDDFLPPVQEGAFSRDALARLPPEPWSAETWATWTEGMADTTSLRVALTGEETGPDLSGLLPLIGRARAERRLRLT